MTYEEFLQKIKSECLYSVFWILPAKNSWDESKYTSMEPYEIRNYQEDLKRKRKHSHKPDWIEVEGVLLEWEIGGVSGGSCWDSSNPTPYHSDNPEPDLEALDKILTLFKPSITFLEYKTLIKKVVKFSSYTKYEFYGNNTQYRVKYFSFKDLFNYLKEREWV